MTLQLSNEQVWQELEKELFAVLGMVTSKGEARTVGIVYVVHDRKIFMATERDTWKVRHIQQNPHVSITVTIPKRIPLIPWIKIPSATISFSGMGIVREPEEAREEVLHSLLCGLETDSDLISSMCVIEVQPVDDFVTYGVGVSLMTMRHPEKARGRAPVK